LCGGGGRKRRSGAFGEGTGQLPDSGDFSISWLVRGKCGCANTHGWGFNLILVHLKKGAKESAKERVKKSEAKE